MRTKKVSWDLIPTVDNVTGIAIYGPSATLFTLSRNHFVQQYDITPSNVALQVASVQHVPANTPPTPPSILEESLNLYGEPRTAVSTEAPLLPTFTDTGESSADEGATMSPLHKIAREMDSLDALQSELRDKVMPLSPTSSRASSTSSRSSGARRRGRKYLYDKPDSSRASSTSDYDGTEFSLGTPSRQGHESMSIRSVSSFASASGSLYRPTNLRKEIMRSPQESKETAGMDLFPCARARLSQVPFRTPHYGNVARTPELLQREMLSVIFGWNDTARALVRDELQRHRPGSASGVLLSKWLGDIGADDMSSMVGSESMTSSDWMLLALSSIGADSQKKVGEAFVQRLLEKGDVHPAVAILLGLGEHNDAIEVYVSQQCWLESVLLTCLTCPADWGRISFLIRKWGETAVQQSQAELAVRCFSCTSVETSEPWFSPRAQDAVYTAQQERLTAPSSAGGMTSPPVSPPSRSGSGRLTAKNASLKLITTFGSKAEPVESGLDDPTPMNAVGVTPIAQSALSPGGMENWQQSRSRNTREPSTARTATPGGFSRRKRLPSRGDIERAQQETATRDFAPGAPRAASRRTSSVGSMQEPTTALKPSAPVDRLPVNVSLQEDTYLPSPAQGVFTRLREESRQRNTSQERKPDGLAVYVMDTRYTDTMSPGPSTQASTRSLGTGASRADVMSPPLTGDSVKSAKARAVDAYISSVESAREQAREKRAQSKRRGESRRRDDSRGGRATSRARDLSETRGRDNARYIKPAKRSPSSPVPMSPEEIAQASLPTKVEPATTDDESFYKITSPVDSHKSMKSGRSEAKSDRKGRTSAGETGAAPRARSRAKSRPRSPDDIYLRADSGRGRNQQRVAGSAPRSPSSPLPMPTDTQGLPELDDTDSERFRLRAGGRTAEEDLQSRRAGSRTRRERSTSRKPVPVDEPLDDVAASLRNASIAGDQPSGSNVSSASESYERSARALSRKELAAKELEQRRMSLARRPSAPAIPLPAQGPPAGTRPSLGQRSHTDLGDSPTSNMPFISRSQTVDPDAMSRYGRITGTSTPSAPIGLPATPRAMRHPRYMSTDPSEREETPPVPEIPENASQLSSLGSSLSQVTGSYVGSNLGSNLESNLTSNLTSNLSSNLTSNLSSEPGEEGDDGIAPLLPSTVFGQKAPQAPARSASAPPEKMSGVHHAYKPALPHSNRRLSHVRKISPPDASHAAMANPTGSVSSIDETLAGSTDQQVVIIPEQEEVPPPMLAELQHLAGPPPPPPPPTMYGQQPAGQGYNSGMISIAMDESAPTTEVPNTLPSTTYPQPMERAQTAAPSSHRRQGSTVSESFGSRFRGIGDRMRSTSRSRVKSPPMEAQYKQAPYETVLPPMPSQPVRRESISRAKSPYELAMDSQARSSQDQIPPPPPPPPGPPAPGMEGRIQETTIPPSSLPPSRSQSAAGYRNPKEIRANMPPQTLQQGVYQGGFL